MSASAQISAVRRLTLTLPSFASPDATANDRILAGGCISPIGVPLLSPHCTLPS
jgi:hypothetical protein